MLRHTASKNLLIATQNFLFGGLETQISGQIKELTNKGWKVHLICGKNYSQGSLLVDAASVTIGLSLEVYPEVSDFRKSIDMIREVIRKNDISIVHAHPFGSLIPAYVASQEESIPMTLTFHGPSNVNTGMGESFEGLIDEVIKNSHVITVSPEIKSMTDQKYGVDSIILPNAVHRTNYRLKMPNKDIRAYKWLIGSRLDRDKIYGIKHFIMLAHEVGLGRIDIAGDGDERDNLEGWCARKGYVNTFFLGRVDNLMSIMSAYDGCAGMWADLLLNRSRSENRRVSLDTMV